MKLSWYGVFCFWLPVATVSKDAPLFGSRSTKRRRTRPARTHPCAGGGRRSTFGNLVDASDSPRVVGAQNRAQEVTPLPRASRSRSAPRQRASQFGAMVFQRARRFSGRRCSRAGCMRDRHASSNYSHMCCMCCVRSHRPRRYNMEESSSRLALSASKRRSDAGARHAQPESKLQVACVAWADTQDLLVDGSPGGEAYRKGAHKFRPGFVLGFIQ